MKIKLTYGQVVMLGENIHDKAIDLIIQVGEDYSDDVIEQVIIPRDNIRYDTEREVYFIKPHIKRSKKHSDFPVDISKHVVSQYIQDLTGLPVHSYEATIIREELSQLELRRKVFKIRDWIEGMHIYHFPCRYPRDQFVQMVSYRVRETFDDDDIVSLEDIRHIQNFIRNYLDKWLYERWDAYCGGGEL